EYDTLKERVDFLTIQSSDLQQSIEALENSIEKINRESRRRFRETFNRVNQKFSVLFPQLFGGGEAYLELTDESNLLESGMDIIAKPPGKKRQNMNLLSGGEKALTAIALVFAVFQIKPSPFCLLDEVDAPLDDANNVRFNQHVKIMTDNSQFIIITHNKRTMEIGDALFGVTMEEPGISKIVSVDFHKTAEEPLQRAV
ncbi:MAG: chromosome segregation protein SMC, partial [Proteobacteria bacterium]|nr:chromosome segregation protein SMC [Pseudomonadota bacterium]